MSSSQWGIGKFTGESCHLKGVGYHSRQSTKRGHRPEAGSSPGTRYIGGGVRPTRRSRLLKCGVGGREGTCIITAGEVGRVQITKKLKLVRRFKHRSDMLRIII